MCNNWILAAGLVSNPKFFQIQPVDEPSFQKNQDRFLTICSKHKIQTPAVSVINLENVDEIKSFFKIAGFLSLQRQSISITICVKYNQNRMSYETIKIPGAFDAYWFCFRELSYIGKIGSYLTNIFIIFRGAVLQQL